MKYELLKHNKFKNINEADSAFLFVIETSLLLSFLLLMVNCSTDVFAGCKCVNHVLALPVNYVALDT